MQGRTATHLDDRGGEELHAEAERRGASDRERRALQQLPVAARPQRSALAKAARGEQAGRARGGQVKLRLPVKKTQKGVRGALKTVKRLPLHCLSYARTHQKIQAVFLLPAPHHQAASKTANVCLGIYQRLKRQSCSTNWVRTSRMASVVAEPPASKRPAPVTDTSPAAVTWIGGGKTHTTWMGSGKRGAIVSADKAQYRTQIGAQNPTELH